MPTSEARIQANRQNSALSTGPRTEEGKAVSRRNGLKHGMTGVGIVLRDEDAAEVERRAVAMLEELQPDTETGQALVRRMALLSLRVERCGELETVATSIRVRRAYDDYEENQGDAVEVLFENLAGKPSATIRQLRRSFEGVGRIILAWNDLRDDLEENVWSSGHGERLVHLKGFAVDDCHALRYLKLSEAITGGTDAAPARARLMNLIDSEIQDWRQFQATIDLDDDEIEERRVEAALLARIEVTPEVALARKYEAAAERGLYRALREARLLEGKSTLVEQQAAQPGGRSQPEPLASSIPATKPPTLPRKPDSSPRQVSSPAPIPPSFSNGLSETGKAGASLLTVGRVE